jgi:hypothetical protein
MSNSMNSNEDGSVTCYMDGTDWECELGAAAGGNTLYPSTLGCLEGRFKWTQDQGDVNDLVHLSECGIAQVEVRFVRWALPPGATPAEIHAFLDCEIAEANLLAKKVQGTDNVEGHKGPEGAVNGRENS